MEEIRFVVPGDPQGKARPRVVHGHAYTPDKTAAYENLVRIAYRQAVQGRPPWDKGIPISLQIEAIFSVTKTVPKKKAQMMVTGKIRPIKKPDTDNVAKIVADALNKIAYDDDAQIVDMRITKYYGQEPMLIVTLRQIPQTEDNDA